MFKFSNTSNFQLVKFDKKSAEKMKSDLDIIIGFVDSISKIDTTGVEPLIYMSEETNVLRADKSKQEVSQQEALKNAPQKDSDYFKVPTILRK